MNGVRIVSVGYGNSTMMLDGDSEARVFPDRTIVLETTGVRRLIVVEGEIRDEKITAPRERERLVRLFQDD